MKGISTGCKKLIVWLAAYVNIIVFALVGGCFFLKDEDEDVKKTTKTAFIVTACFIGVEVIISLIRSISGLADSTDYTSLNNLTYIITIIKIIVYVGFLIFDFFSYNKTNNVSKEKPIEEEEKAETTEETTNE